MLARRCNVVRTEGSTAYIDVGTPSMPNAVALVDIADLSLVLDGRGSWFAWRATKPSATTYAKRHRKGSERTDYMHRLILPAPFVDHRDGNGLDNRRANLRAASHAQNNRNRVGVAGTSSRFKGVWFESVGGKWVAGIKYAGRSRYLGRFLTEIGAAQAYDDEAVRVFGEFARTNFGGKQ